MKHRHYTEMANWEVMYQRDCYIERIEFIHHSLFRLYDALSDIEKHCTYGDEQVMWLHGLLTNKAKLMDEEAELLVTLNGNRTDHLVQQGCNRYSYTPREYYD